MASSNNNAGNVGNGLGDLASRAVDTALGPIDTSRTTGVGAVVGGFAGAVSGGIVGNTIGAPAGPVGQALTGPVGSAVGAQIRA